MLRPERKTTDTRWLVRLLIILLLASVSVLIICSDILPLASLWILGLSILAVKKNKIKIKNAYIFDIAALCIVPLFTLYFSQLILLVQRLPDSGYISLFCYMNRLAVKKNELIDLRFPTELLLIALIYLLLRLCRVNRKIAAVITPIPFLVMALVDYYVFTFRGSEFLFSDIYGIGTAMNVIHGYELPLMLPFGGMIAPYILLVLCVLNFSIGSDKTAVNQKKDLLICLTATVIASGLFVLLFMKYANTRDAESYQDKASQSNGFTMNFVLSIYEFRLEKPEGYDEAYIEDLISESETYAADVSEASNIIVIMNESYSDFDIYSDILGDFSADTMPFVHGLEENTARGYAYSSVFGGRTANAEYEYLTGLTTYSLPDGYLPYSVSLHSNTFSIATYLSSNGYHTVAMHPYYGNSWNRDRVYMMLGFDDTVFVTDDYSYSLPEDQINGYLTDRNAYDNVISILENAPEDQKQFIFLVTIQNHGGYTGELDNLENYQFIDPGEPDAESINNYMSLVKTSDEALEYLINYLSECDERYTVVFFGDHQPQLGFNDDYAGQFGDRGWMVPYVIWSNYDNGLSSNASEYDSPETSMNYLSIDTLRAAGVDLPPYFAFISEVRDRYPVITSAGYETASDDQGSELLHQYLSLRYYTLVVM